MQERLLFRRILLGMMLPPLLLVGLPLAGVAWGNLSPEAGVRWMAIALAALAPIVGIVSVALTRQLTRPIKDLTRVANLFAEGELAARARPFRSREWNVLAEALHRMAARLDDERRKVDRLLEEQKAIFYSLAEGLLVVDAQERVVEMNEAAAALLSTDPAQARGRSLMELARNLTVQRLVADVLQGITPAEADVAVQTAQGERFLKVRGTTLRLAGESSARALMVLSDITGLRKLESIRRDFVANASHELKTPVTSIKGFAETLLHGQPGAEETRRFVGIIDRQADQLSSLIDDLLDLTRIEHEQERGSIALEERSLREIVDLAVERCSAEAALRRIRVEVEGDAAIRARVEPSLLERALVNLIENAIKYSEPDRTVRVSIRASGGNVHVAVRDEGFGIAAENLPRIFERFYRVDKARSRKLGGTGLGLAIVKHAVQAQRGEIHVESQPGKGSVFTIRLPAPRA